MTARPLTLSLSLSLAALSLSCGDGVAVEHEDASFQPGDEVDFGTEPFRERRRMTIDQLDASLRAATGGIGWEHRTADGTVDREFFRAYADSLGVPDYVDTTLEDRSVSLVFQKFLDDAARSVCRRLVDREARDAPVYEGVPRGIFAPVDLSRPESTTEGASDRALAALLLRFHGRRVDAASSELSSWRALLSRLDEVAAAERAPPRRVWEGVCVALVTHPDFFTY